MLQLWSICDGSNYYRNKTWMRLKILYGNNLYDGYNGSSYTTSYIVEFQYIPINQLSSSCLFSNLFAKESDVVTW